MKQKTPDESAEDISLIIRKYSVKYHINKVYLCGYSFGADVLPFVYNRLSPSVKKKVVALQLLSPYHTTDFVVHFGDLISTSRDNYQYKVNTEIIEINIPVYCFYGKAEVEKPLNNLKQKNFSLNYLNGNHRYDESEYDKIVNTFDALKN